MGPVHLSFPQSVRNTFGVFSLCNLELQKISFIFIQTYRNDCSHIKDVHLPFCAHFMNIFSYLRGVGHFSVQKC